MKEQEPTVFIVDDDTAVLKGLEALLEAVRLRAETYLTADDFFANYNRSRLGCLILDIRMPRIGGVEVFRRLREEGSDIPVIFLTGHGDISMAVSAMREGAFDFLEKPFNEQYLLDRVQAAIAADGQNRQRHTERGAVAARLKALSPRELEVVDHLMDGKTGKVMARDLGVGHKTVDFHRANIMRRMGVETVAELVYLLVSGGYSKQGHHSPTQNSLVAAD